MNKNKNIIGFPYKSSIEKDMKMFYNSLNEKDRRHYAALEAKKLIHGGITYIADLLGCDRDTVHAGIEEFKKK
jgi:hypothetical protein